MFEINREEPWETTKEPEEMLHVLSSVSFVTDSSEEMSRWSISCTSSTWKRHMGKQSPMTHLKQDNTAYIRGASKYKQKDQVTELKRFHEGKAIYNEVIKRNCISLKCRVFVEIKCLFCLL